MPDFQTFIAILTTLLVFLTGIFLNYDTIEFRNYPFSIPQWFGLLFAAITFCLVALDQLLRGFVRLEEVQRNPEEEQRRVREEQRRAEEEQRRAEERNRSLEAAERETRRTRIETRYRTATLRFQLEPNSFHRQQLADLLALLEEYRDTL